MSDIVIQRLEGESKNDYIDRVCSLKDTYKLKWGDITRILNKALDANYDESVFRKGYASRLKEKAEKEEASEKQTEIAKSLVGVLKEYDVETTEDEMKELFEAQLALKKEKVKLSDERIQTNAYIRQLAREDTIKEIALQCAKEMNSKKILKEYNNDIVIKKNDNRAILEISDWHYGIDIKNYWNTYNPEIAKKRVCKLKDETIAKCQAYGVKELHVVNLSDLIAGRIHLGLRLESRFDVITQVMQVSEMLAEMLNELSNYFTVHYYDCLDNHSRLEPNKNDSMDLESLARIIPWYLKERLRETIFIHENEYDEGIISFKCGKYSIIGCHGDHDKPNKVVDNMTLMTQNHYDMVLTAHYHHFSADENHFTVVVSNGSLMGTDTYAKNLRLCSKPSQNLIIVTDKSVCEDICRIILD